MSNTNERAEFEAWASHPDRHGKLPIEAHPNGAYKDNRTYTAYYGWAAAKKTKAQQVAVPMTAEQIADWYASENGIEDCGMCFFADFEKVVRAVEAKQGIGEKP